MGALAYFVKYPDYIKADLVITAPNPPVDLIAEKNGLLEVVKIIDHEHVEEGDLLLVYSSGANLFDIDTLEADLAYFSGELSNADIENFTPKRNLNLGKLEENYAEFLANFDVFIYGAVSNNDQKSVNRLLRKIKDVQADIVSTNRELNGVDLSNRLRTYKNEFISEQNKYNAAVKASTDKEDLKTFLKDLKDASRRLDEARKDSSDLRTKIKESQLQINSLRKDIAEIKQEGGEDRSNSVFKIQENINVLKAKIKTWKKDHLVFAPISGQVFFNEEYDNENQTVEEGTKILQIIPPGEVGDMFGKVDLPQAGSAAVEDGQEVIIKIDNYPFFEFGAIIGKVKSKSEFPQDNNTYKVEVDLTNGLLTNKGKEIEFRQGMQGTAEIKTKEKRIISRLFENVFNY